jgi:hypothetical protein
MNGVNLVHFVPIPFVYGMVASICGAIKHLEKTLRGEKILR